MLEVLSNEARWRAFLSYLQADEHAEAWRVKDLMKFIERGEYVPVASSILSGGPLPLPSVHTLSKMGTNKKRTVFTFPRDVNWAMKLLAFEMRAFDGLFPPSLHSFRPGHTARDALLRLTRTPGIRNMHAYKTDIHDYFNSVDVNQLLPMLREAFPGDGALVAFFEDMLTNPNALCEGTPVPMQKGVMAGTPLSPFLANLYLTDVDRQFEAAGLPYARYSDDIILFAPDEETLRRQVQSLRDLLAQKGLTVNPRKEAFAAPGEAWTFLGFSCRNGVLDVAPASVEKLKGKMHRKARALLRWAARHSLEGDKAARAFIRRMNQKLYENPDHNDICWARWYFPVIGTDASLRLIDRYMQDCIRYIACGHHGKKRFGLRYETMKDWGYRPLVHEFYAHVRPGQVNPEKFTK